MGVSFRHSAGFGKRMEYNLVGKMLMEGLDVYLPLVDDHGVDCVIKKEDGTFIEIQIKARLNEVTFGDAGLFAAITHDFRPVVKLMIKILDPKAGETVYENCTTSLIRIQVA